MNIAQWCIDRPVATVLATLGIIVAAWAGAARLPIAALPQVDFPTLEVTGALPGASPETMAATVAAPLEQEFQRISGLTAMSSTSTMGLTTITLQFTLRRNIDAAAGDVQKAINAARAMLPKSMPAPPTYDKVNPAQNKVLTLALTSDSIPLPVVDEYATQFLIRPLSQLTGIGLVDMNGAEKPAIRVQINPTALASLGLTLEDVRSALGAATDDGPKGILSDSNTTVTLASNGQLLDARATNAVIVAYRNGAPVRIRDIGRAISSVEDIHSVGWYQGRRAILVDVHLQPGANLVAVIDEVKAHLPGLLRQLPPDIAVHLLGDRSVTIRAAVRDMKLTLAITIGLVVAVVFMFVRRLWATLIPSIAIPISLMIAGGVMYLLGYSLDNLSFMALAIAVGFVVDDAIVMIENVSRHIEAGESPTDAASRGAREITFTIVSMTLSLIAVFLPLLLMGGMTGRMLREFAVTVSVALLASAAVSLTLTPVMCSRMMRREVAAEQNWLARWCEGAFHRLLRVYQSSLEWALTHRPLVLGIWLALLAATVALAVAVPKGFIPQQDVGIIVGSTQFPPGISFARASRLQQQVTYVARSDPDVADVSSFIQPDHLTRGLMYVDLKPFGERKVSISQVIARLRPKTAQVAGVRFTMQPVQDIQIGGHLTSAQFQFSLQDANLRELYHWAPLLTARLRKLPALRDVVNDLEPAAPHARIVIDRDSAARLGITSRQIDSTLYDAFGQRQVATLYTQFDQFHIVLEVDPRFQLDTRDLRHLYLRSADGRLVPLGAISHLQRYAAPDAVSHLGQFPGVTISCNLAPGVSLGEAVQAVQAAERGLGMPPSLRASFEGAARAFQSSLASEPYLIAAAILAVFIVLGMLYEGIVHPVTILSTLPAAGVGALAALVLTGGELDVMSLVGIILLIGLVKKNAIMMVDFAIAARRVENWPPERAIYQAALLRFRPIMMTTMTALLGSLPLALGTGAGSELRRPLGIAVAGGLLVSQLLTLYTTPVLFIYLERLAQRAAGMVRVLRTRSASAITSAAGRS